MSRMQHMNIAKLEVRALIALEALLRGKSVNKAAQQVGLSQPAMSHMLARLRKTFGDQLLVRGRSGLVLTEQGERLLLHLSQLAPQIEALGRSDRFDPRSSRATFRMACTDHASVVLSPPLLLAFSTAAPQAILKVLSVPSRHLDLPQLEATRFDLVVGWFDALPADWHVKKLFDEHLVVLASATNASIGATLDMDAFLSLKHVVLAPDERELQNMADMTLATRGLKRNVGAFVSNFSATPYIVAESQLIAMIPSTLAARYAHVPGVRLHAPPAEFPHYPVSMAWHPRVHAEPGHRWLRQLMIDAANKVAPNG